MKKIAIASVFVPAMTFAHESHTRNSFVHALEHHLANPWFAVVLAVGVAGLAYAAKQFFQRR